MALCRSSIWRVSFVLSFSRTPMSFSSIVIASSFVASLLSFEILLIRFCLFLILARSLLISVFLLSMDSLIPAIRSALSTKLSRKLRMSCFLESGAVSCSWRRTSQRLRRCSVLCLFPSTDWMSMFFPSPRPLFARTDAISIFGLPLSFVVSIDWKFSTTEANSGLPFVKSLRAFGSARIFCNAWLVIMPCCSSACSCCSSKCTNCSIDVCSSSMSSSANSSAVSPITLFVVFFPATAFWCPATPKPASPIAPAPTLVATYELAIAPPTPLATWLAPMVMLGPTALTTDSKNKDSTKTSAGTVIPNWANWLVSAVPIMSTPTTATISFVSKAMILMIIDVLQKPLKYCLLLPTHSARFHCLHTTNTILQKTL